MGNSLTIRLFSSGKARGTVAKRGDYQVDNVQVGLISDTHGVLRSEACKILQGCAHIIHAGDINKPEILAELRQIAPTTAVKGNMDLGSWAQELKEVERLEINGRSLVVVHNLMHLDLFKEQADVVVYGHTHRFAAETRNGILLVNPGSAGPRRFALPITMAVLTIGEQLTVKKACLKNRA